MLARSSAFRGWSKAASEDFMHRKPVNKHHSAKVFKRHVGKTKLINMKAAPMRGGIRL